jgi:peptide deformylase
MTAHNILHFPDQRLSQKAVPVEAIDANIQTLIEDLFETMYTRGGVGLSATQINIPKRVIVLDISDEKNQPIHLINPEIIQTNGKSSFIEEQCLSIPSIYEPVKRAEQIVMRYLDRNGRMHQLEADGLLASYIQHEIDHLNGELFIEHLSPSKRKSVEKKLERFKRENP